MTSNWGRWSPRAVCFDLDDTLYEYRRYAYWGLQAAADRLAVETGREVHDELLDLYFTDGVTDGTFDTILERHDLPTRYVEPMVEAFHDTTKPLRPYPGTEHILERLRENHRLGVVTDGRNGTQKLRELGLLEYFEAVVVTPTVGTSKTEQAAFDRLLRLLVVSAEDTVYVGDDPRVDFRIPNQLGMGTVRLRRGRYVDIEPVDTAAAPDVEISTLSELLRLLGTPMPFPLNPEP